MLDVRFTASFWKSEKPILHNSTRAYGTDHRWFDVVFVWEHSKQIKIAQCTWLSQTPSLDLTVVSEVVSHPSVSPRREANVGILARCSVLTSAEL